MKEETGNEKIGRKDNLSQWIQKFEEHCLKNADIDEDVKGYVEYSMKVSEKPRTNFHEKYLHQLDENLDVLSSKENYEYHDFYRKPDPYISFPKGFFKSKHI